MSSALPPIVDHQTWRAALGEPGKREKADSPEGWSSRPTYCGWLDSPDIAGAYGPKDHA
jgi:hypothetical protein